MRRISQHRAIATLIDELGQLDAELAALKEKQDRQAVLRAELIALLGLSPKDSVSEDGEMFQVQIGAQRIKRTIRDKGRLYQVLGKKKFVDHCTFPLEALDRLTNALERK